MSISYPNDIYTFEGFARVHQGHGLDVAELLNDIQHAAGREIKAITTEEVWMHYRPRVMHCDRFDALCDLNGEWHGHWSEVQPSAGSEYTIVHSVTQMAL